MSIDYRDTTKHMKPISIKGFPDHIYKANRLIAITNTLIGNADRLHAPCVGHLLNQIYELSFDCDSRYLTTTNYLTKYLLEKVYEQASELRRLAENDLHKDQESEEFSKQLKECVVFLYMLLVANAKDCNI